MILQKLKLKGEATTDVIAIAKKIKSKLNNIRFKKEEARIMRSRISEKARETRVARNKWIRNSTLIDNDLAPEDRIVFGQIRSSEVDRVWKLESERFKLKLARKVIELPDIHAGILVGDNTLHERHGDVTIDPCIEGGIVASENMLSYIW